MGLGIGVLGAALLAGNGAPGIQMWKDVCSGQTTADHPHWSPLWACPSSAGTHTPVPRFPQHLSSVLQQRPVHFISVPSCAHQHVVATPEAWHRARHCETLLPTLTE